jgi:hypothetical protein
MLTLLVAGLAATSPLAAQTAPNTTIEGTMDELYAAVTRVKGAPFAWDRLRAITLPFTLMLPQRRTAESEDRPMTVEQFIAWIDEGWRPVIGTASDRGFFERQLKLVVHQYGDIAMAFTSYEKGSDEPRAVQGRGINTVQLVRRGGRWFITAITWDEESTAGPIPAEYRGN